MKNRILFLSLVIVHHLYPYTGLFSEKPKGEPAVNFYGTIKTNDGQTLNVENVTISGKFENIDLYKQPKTQKIDPKKYAIFPNLIDIKEIRVNNKPFSFQPPKRPHSKSLPSPDKYCSLTLIFKDGNKQHVLIPQAKRLWTDQKIGKKLEKQKICFDVLRNISIEGYKNKKDKEVAPSPDYSNSSRSSRVIPKELYRGATESDTIKLNAIQATIMRIGHIFTQLASASKSQYDVLKDTLEQLFKDLKDSFDRAFS